MTFKKSLLFFSRFDEKKTLIFALCLDQHPARRPQRSKILQKENASVCLLFCGRSVLNHSRLGRGWLSEARSQCLTTLSRPLLVLAWSSYWHSAAVFLSSRTKLPCFSQRLAWPWRKDHIFATKGVLWAKWQTMFLSGFLLYLFPLNYLFWDKELLCCHLKRLNSSNFQGKVRSFKREALMGMGWSFIALSVNCDARMLFSILFPRRRCNDASKTAQSLWYSLQGLSTALFYRVLQHNASNLCVYDT